MDLRKSIKKGAKRGGVVLYEEERAEAEMVWTCRRDGGYNGRGRKRHKKKKKMMMI